MPGSITDHDILLVLDQQRKLIRLHRSLLLDHQRLDSDIADLETLLDGFTAQLSLLGDIVSVFVQSNIQE